MKNILKTLVICWLAVSVLGRILSCKKPCNNDFKGKIYEREVIGFYPYWKMGALAITDIQWQYLTRIIFAFAHPEENGDLNTTHVSVWSEQLVQAAHKNGVEAYLSIGGGGGRSDNFTKVAAQKETRERFVEAVTGYLEAFCYDGVDIDWEYLSYSKDGKHSRLEQKSLVLLLHDLKKRLEPLGKSVSVDVYGAIWSGDFFLDEVAEYADQIHIMAYDFSGKWSEPMPHASVEQAFGLNKKQSPSGIHYYRDIRKWSRTKLYLGLPFYGRDFNHAHVPGKPYREIIAEYPEAYLKDDFNNIYYNGHPAIRKKIEMVKEYDLPGVMIWELSQDALHDNSLLKIVGEELIYK